MARRNRTEAVVADDAKKAAQLTGKASRGQARLPVFTGRARGFGSDPREAISPISSRRGHRQNPLTGSDPAKRDPRSMAAALAAITVNLAALAWAWSGRGRDRGGRLEAADLAREQSLSSRTRRMST